jgi:hypothetical protein
MNPISINAAAIAGVPPKQCIIPGARTLLSGSEFPERTGVSALLSNSSVNIRIAAMNNDRQPQRPRRPNLPPKNIPLHIARRMIIIIIKPYLAPRDNLPALRQLN